MDTQGQGADNASVARSALGSRVVSLHELREEQAQLLLDRAGQWPHMQRDGAAG